MQTLPAPHGSHIPMRRFVRHPREIFALVVAIMTSVFLLFAAFGEVALAMEQDRTPDVYALALIFAPVLIWFARGQLWAMQRLNGIKLTPEQFPEAYAMLVDAAGRSGLSYVPDAYVVLGNGAINAGASGHGFRRFVIINSDLFEVGGASREPDALRFVIAHEVGHIAAGHASYWRILGTLASEWIPVIGSTLSRAQEYTADNYGHILAPQGARSAMATLAGGKYLNRSVDVDAMADRAVTEPGFFVWVTNALGSHPVLVWRMHALRDRRRPGRLLWRPREAWLWRQPSGPGAHSLPPMVGFTPGPGIGTVQPDRPQSVPVAMAPVAALTRVPPVAMSKPTAFERREFEVPGEPRPPEEADRWTP